MSEARIARAASSAEQVVGEGGLPKVVMRSADGAQAHVHLHGAHTISWRPAPGIDERLFVSGRAKYADGTSIRGGIPIIFPQFAAEGPLPRHGFARTMRWKLGEIDTESDGDVVASFLLPDSPETRAIWPVPFLATIKVRIGGARLCVSLTVDNTGPDLLSFTAALHTYLRVKDVSDVNIVGLHGCRYRENGAPGALKFDNNETLRIPDAIDRVYFGAPRRVIVREPARQLAIDSVAFPDLVVWNPGARDAEPKFEMAPGEHREMVCVEAAVIGTPVTLLPDRRWTGSQTVVVQPRDLGAALGDEK